jgi:hypothetical protein
MGFGKIVWHFIRMVKISDRGGEMRFPCKQNIASAISTAFIVSLVLQAIDVQFDAVSIVRVYNPDSYSVQSLLKCPETSWRNSDESVEILASSCAIARVLPQ